MRFFISNCCRCNRVVRLNKVQDLQHAPSAALPSFPPFLLQIPKNNLYWNLVKLVCPQISSFQSGFSTSGHSIASFGGSRGSGENLDAGNPTPAVTPGTTPGNPRGSGVFPAAHQLPREFSRGESVADGAEPATSPPFAEVFRSVPRFSRRDPMSVFLPPERAEQLRLSRKFLSFLTACLKYDAEKRITAREMLEHPFLQVMCI